MASVKRRRLMGIEDVLEANVQTSSMITVIKSLALLLLGVSMAQYNCQPTPVAVKVPNDSVWPNFVNLSRCMGGCYVVNDAHECTVKSKRNFILKVFDLTIFDYAYIPMTDHTSCDCTCRTKPGHCNNVTQFDLRSCSCQCIDRSHTCDPKTKVGTNGIK